MPLSLARERWISAIMEATDKAEVETIIEVAQAIVKAEAVVDRTTMVTITMVIIMVKAGEAILAAAQAIMDMTGEIVLTIPILEISNQIECSQEQDLAHGRIHRDTDRIRIIIKIIIITVKNQMKITITQNDENRLVLRSGSAGSTISSAREAPQSGWQIESHHIDVLNTQDGGSAGSTGGSHGFRRGPP